MSGQEFKQRVNEAATVTWLRAKRILEQQEHIAVVAMNEDTEKLVYHGYCAGFMHGALRQQKNEHYDEGHVWETVVMQDECMQRLSPRDQVMARAGFAAGFENGGNWYRYEFQVL